MEKLSLQSDNDVTCFSEVLRSKKNQTGISGYYWTSATSDSSRTDFKWDKNKPVFKKFWRSGFPREPRQQLKCTVIQVKNKYTAMENVLCSKRFKPICQKALSAQSQKKVQTKCSATCPTLPITGQSGTKYKGLHQIPPFGLHSHSLLNCNNSFRLLFSPTHMKDVVSIAIASYTLAVSVKEMCDSLFVFSNEEMNYQNAIEFCKTLEKTVNKCGSWTAKMISFKSLNKYSCLKESIQGIFWTSARDDGCPKNFVWCSDTNSSNKNVNEKLWQKGAPDNLKGKERCAVVNFKTGLNDRNCNLSYTAACEVVHRNFNMFATTTPRPEICKIFEPKQNLKTTVPAEKYSSLGAWTVKCRNLYHFSYQSLNISQAFEYCTSLGMELLYIESLEEMNCIKSFTDENEEMFSDIDFWTSGISSDFGKPFVWCNGPGGQINERLWTSEYILNIYTTVVFAPPSTEPLSSTTKSVTKTSTKVTASKDKELGDDDAEDEIDEEGGEEETEEQKSVETGLHSLIDYRKERLICKLPEGTTPKPYHPVHSQKKASEIKPTTTGTRVSMQNTFFPTIARPATNFPFKLPGSINTYPNFKACLPICAPFQPKDLTLFQSKGTLRAPQNLGTLITVCQKDYILSRNMMPQFTAAQFCFSLGMALFFGESVRDLDCLKNAMPILGSTDVWTSAVDMSCSRRFQGCSNNHTVLDILWAPDQPPYSDQHRCARLSKTRLKRDFCTPQLQAFCQRFYVNDLGDQYSGQDIIVLRFEKRR